MSEELKTLKDMGRIVIKNNLYDAVDGYEIKREAVKRAKHFRHKKDIEKDALKFCYWEGRYIEVMEMHNLTEEDLKQEKEK